MKDFNTYSPREVIEGNLAENEERFLLNCEQGLAHLRELADLITEGHAAREDDFIPSLPDHSPRRCEPFADTPPILTAVISDAASMRAVRNSVFLCAAIRDNIGGDGAIPMSFFFRETSELTGDAAGRVSYQKSGYTDAAFLRFSASIPSLRAHYAPRFSAGCENVYNGVSEYCILPIETSQEGTLNSFFRLLDHYSLRIKAVCRIPTPDAAHTTRYALIGQTSTPITLNKRYAHFFEFTLPLTGAPTVAEVLMAAQLAGLRLSLFSTLPPSDEGEAPKVRFSFSTETGHLDTFLLYLAMEAPHHEVIGVFSQIE